jgi:signal transduction histidine kinase
MTTVPSAVKRARRRLGWSMTGLPERASRSPLAFDIAFAMVMGLLTLAGSLAESHPLRSNVPAGHHVPVAPPAAYLLVLASALVLIWRRRRPVLVLAGSLAGALAYTCLGYFDGAALLTPVVALYAVAVAVPTVRAVILSTLTMIVLMAASAAFDPLGATGGAFPLIPGEVVAALLLGLWVASRRAYARRDSAEQARRAVDAERLRIARELHDVVAHTMATINVQAGVAGHVIAEQPEQAAKALDAIKRASKEGLRELRGILNVLRQANEEDATAPAPGLAQLAALIEGTTRAGLAATVTIHGEPRPLPPTVDLAAYRIVQESLTNALRHADPTAATVSLAYSADQLEIEVLDGGRGDSAPALPGSGHGIPGMRERAAAVGGDLHAGPAPAGGFRVYARLPISGS